jgi:hypothetical protein
MVNLLKNNFPETLPAILSKINWTDFGVKLNLNIYTTVKDFLILFLPVIPFVNVRKRKTRGLYHVLRGDMQILVPTHILKFWLYLPRRL